MLYLLVTQSADVLTGETLHLIKIGHTSRAITARLNEYKTSNPMTTIVAIRKGNIKQEQKHHNILITKFNAIPYYGEWYTVSSEVFTDIVNYGFKAFRKNADNMMIYKNIKDI